MHTVTCVSDPAVAYPRRPHVLIGATGSSWSPPHKVVAGIGIPAENVPSVTPGTESSLEEGELVAESLRLQVCSIWDSKAIQLQWVRWISPSKDINSLKAGIISSDFSGLSLEYIVPSL